MYSAASRLRSSQGVRIRNESPLITLIPATGSKKADCPALPPPPPPVLGAQMKAATAPMQPSGNNSGPRKPRKLCVPAACERCLRPPVGVSTLPFGPRCPLPGFLPCPPWWLDPLLGALNRLTSSSRCPRAASGAVARLASLDAGFSDRKSTASQRQSGPATTPGRAMRAGCSADGVVRGGLGECTRGL